MASVAPRLTFATPNVAQLDPRPLLPSLQRESNRPSDLKSFPSTDGEAPGPFEDNIDNFYSLRIPSPTYQLMFTPTFLMASYNSEDDYSDGFSISSTDELIFNQIPLPPWTSTAEHVKPVVNRLIDHEKLRHDSVRLSWRPTLPATPTTSTHSSSASLGFEASSADALETQSSSCVPCLGRSENPTIDSHEIGPLLRKSQSLPNLLSESSLARKTFFDVNTVGRSGFVYTPKDEEDAIKRWASDITFTP